jgi:hypothetical protein
MTDIGRDESEDASLATHDDSDGNSDGDSDATNSQNQNQAEGQPQFDDETSQEIDDLLIQIGVEVSKPHTGNKWTPAEEGLLILLRQLKLPYAQIHEVSTLLLSLIKFRRLSPSLTDISAVIEVPSPPFDRCMWDSPNTLEETGPLRWDIQRNTLTGRRTIQQCHYMYIHYGHNALGPSR